MWEKATYLASCIDELRGAYLENMRLRRYSEASIKTYETPLLDFGKYVTEQEISRVQNIGLEHLRGYQLSIIDRKFTPASVFVYMRAIKQFFCYLEKEQHILVNPALRLEPCREPRRLIPAPTQEEVRILLDSVDVSRPVGLRDRALLETAYAAGLRRQELRTLRLSSINFDEGTLRVLGKGSKERIVPLTESALYWLGRYIKEAWPKLAEQHPDETHLWVCHPGLPLSYALTAMTFRKYRNVPGIRTNITPHSLRRACATHMLENGAHPVDIQMLLGHASLRHLSQYLSLTITELQSVHQNSNPGQ